MKKLIIPVLIAGLALTSCKKTEEVKTDDTSVNAATPKTSSVDSTAVVSTGDTTETSVDWNGTYTGKIPCADCPGIETKLILNNDKTYTLDENYLERKDGKFSEKGTFTWSKDGSFITLNNGEKDAMQKVFFVGENQVFIAEKVGDRSEKPEYKLEKK
ncbi:MAG TPA: copper resistance protein NlpE [Kaistella sp.]|nr:copper resistance protein NlpE [Kaistella sp.]